MPFASNRGSIDRLLLSAVALSVASILGGVAYARSLEPSAVAVFALALVAGIGLLGAELRSDPREAAPLVVVAGMVAFLVFGSIWRFASESHPVAGGVAILGGGLVLATAVMLALNPARPDPTRYALLGKFGAGAVAETDGVQFVVQTGEGVGAARRDLLQVWLENTFSARRDVEVSVALPPGSPLVVPAGSSASLGPLEVGVLSIPVSVRPGAPSSQTLRVWLSARGGGRRSLPWRALRAEKPPQGIFRWLGILAALLHPLHASRFLGLKGGVKVTLYGTPERSDVAGLPRSQFRRVPRSPADLPRREVEARLLAERIVFLGVPIDDETATEVIAKLRLLRDRDRAAPLSLYINSPGGSVPAALAVFDAVKELTLTVSTVCMGKAHGVAALLLAAGRPGHRFAALDATIRLTPVDGIGDISNAEVALVERFAACTGQPARLIERAMAEHVTMDAVEARRLGFVDGTLDRSSGQH